MWRLAIIFPVFALCGCAYFYARPPSRVEAAQQSVEYVIAAGDVVQISVWQNTELTLTVTVRPDGNISMPLLGDVQAAGRTPMQLSSFIQGKLGSFVHSPQVTTIIQTANGQGGTNIKVLGEAIQPRIVPYHVGITLIEVMAEAGGLTDYADGNRASLIRVVGGKSHRYRLRIASLLKSGNMAANVELAPGDVINIPERWY